MLFRELAEGGGIGEKPQQACCDRGFPRDGADDEASASLLD